MNMAQTRIIVLKMPAVLTEDMSDTLKHVKHVLELCCAELSIVEYPHIAGITMRYGENESLRDFVDYWWTMCSDPSKTFSLIEDGDDGPTMDLLFFEMEPDGITIKDAFLLNKALMAFRFEPTSNKDILFTMNGHIRRSEIINALVKHYLTVLRDEDGTYRKQAFKNLFGVDYPEGDGPPYPDIWDFGKSDETKSEGDK
jgi:hypothetical protein